MGYFLLAKDVCTCCIELPAKIHTWMWHNLFHMSKVCMHMAGYVMQLPDTWTHLFANQSPTAYVSI